MCEILGNVGSCQTVIILKLGHDLGNVCLWHVAILLKLCQVDYWTMPSRQGSLDT